MNMWAHSIYFMIDLSLVDVASVLVWCVLSRGGYRVMRRVVSLYCPRSIMG